MLRVAILGAGISGLTLAYYLKKNFQNKILITVIEKEEEVGGVIRSEKKEGRIIEWGPKSIKAFGKGGATDELINDLSLKKKELSPKTKNRYLVVKGRLKKVPSFFFFKTLTLGIIKDIFSKGSQGNDETIASFFIRHFGKRFTYQFVDPFIKGIFAGNLEELSMKACLPTIYELEKKHRSVVLGLKKSSNKRKMPAYSFKDGLQELPKKIYQAVDANFLLGKKVFNIKAKDKEIELEINNNEVLSFDFVFSTLPANALYGAGIKITALKEIPFFDVNVFTLCFDKKLKMNEGFGYLVPEKEKENILGAVFDSLLFDEEKTQITVMAKNEATLSDAKRALKKHLGIEEEPSFVIKNCLQIPQYTLGHLKRVEEIEEKLKTAFPRLRVLGSSFYGVSINDCIYEAKKAADCLDIFSDP